MTMSPSASPVICAGKYGGDDANIGIVGMSMGMGIGITAGIDRCHGRYSGGLTTRGGNCGGCSCGGVDGPGDEPNDMLEVEGDGVCGGTFAKRTRLAPSDAIVDCCSVVKCGIDDYKTLWGVWLR